MSDKVPYVKISARFHLHDAPEGWLGLRGENWAFGKGPVDFDPLVARFVHEFLKFYLATMPHVPTEQLNAQIQELGKYILNLRVEEK